MRTRLLSIALAAAATVCAADSDRQGIEHLVAALSDSHTSIEQKAGLFTKDARGEFDRLAALEYGNQARRPWSEVTEPYFVIRSVRFLTPEVALVDVDYRQIGSLGPMLRVPVLLVLRRESVGWRIAAFRPYTANRPFQFVRPHAAGDGRCLCRADCPGPPRPE